MTCEIKEHTNANASMDYICENNELADSSMDMSCENNDHADVNMDADIGLRIRWCRDKSYSEIAVIVEVVPWSPAMREGTIRAGDVLTSVNGIAIKGYGDIKHLFGAEGTTVELSVLRPRRDRKIENQYLNDFEGPLWPNPIKRDRAYRNIESGIPRKSWPDPSKFQDRSLIICGLQWRFRLACILLQDSLAWQMLCLTCILTNMVMLTMTDPLELQYNQSNYMQSTLTKVDFALTVFFVVEAVVKVIAHGFVFGHSAYLDSWLNRIDFIVVLCSVADLCIYSLMHSLIPLMDTSKKIPYEYSTFVTSVKAMRSFR
jgi:hypothetical protein